MKRPPKTDMEIRFRRLLEENFPYTVIQSRKGNIPDWKRAIIDYLYNEKNLYKFQIARILDLDHSTVGYHIKNEIYCKDYDEFKKNVFSKFKETFQEIPYPF